MTFAAALPGLISAGGSILGGLFGAQGSRPKETKMQKTQRKLVDQLISSLGGNGPYSDLYNADESAFQKSFVEPAKAKFNNQIAPQIQQQYIESGQQYGTGLEDQLLRAGVDLDSLLNQHMMEFQQGAQNRKQNTINSILGSGSGAPTPPSTGQNLMSAAGGYLSSPAFSDLVSGSFRNQNQQPNNSINPYVTPPRKGFEPDWRDYKLGDPRWGQ